MAEKPPLVAIYGPTAVGKTALAIALAKRFDGEVLSADSRQFYRDMQIGTARPLEAQMHGVVHHFMGFLPVQATYTAAHFEQEALACVARIHSAHKLPIACGGSGMYMRALLHGLDDLPSSETLRKELQNIWKNEGLEAIQKRILNLDPQAALRIDLQNPMRVLRAIELCTLTGNTIDALRTGIPKDRPFRTLKIGLELPRNELYARIHARADAMMAAGLEAEAKNLFAERHRQALQTVGYKELYAYMDGQCTREEAVERIKQNTRRYAKRQLTWMRGEPDMHWFHPDATPQIEAQVREFLNRP